ncbi:glycoside hydrolase family 3 protein [Alteraurantiacibacter aquimixticola]|uniref:beta-glucosidase n=1 Tax=Alteraurantiacibacter aquimixticola TaxID=2489173 RepID=A0A4T3F812_9SPHN|nr:glycoside hydrolase family 3 N-terminal domain-containing protein [Alteraurantiacibacter aquimixticola]TIX51882.1 glycoside hydrolase family 3 protein [Alteraurantiacibacter aquimixticola]
MKCDFRAVALAALALGGCAGGADEAPSIESRSIAVLEADGISFRDLDRDGALTPFEDWRLSPAERAADLTARMTLAEKAGVMVVATLPGNAPWGEPATGYDIAAFTELLERTHATHFISRLSTKTEDVAAANNAAQEAAEAHRLGIPAVIVTDPRHGFTELAGASVAGGEFSQWPNGVGLAAFDDPEFVESYAALVRDDLRAAGFALLLGPQIDLATEPRWPRNFDTYGEDAEVSAATAAAFVRGLQGGADGLQRNGVASVIKHFAGYSASSTGFDAHNYYGRHSRLNLEEWEQHLRPFIGALEAHPAGVMPAYSILEELELDGEPVEQVGVGYNRRILTGVLREELGFDGVLLSDWAITRDCNRECVEGAPAGQAPSFAEVSTAWGAEDLSVEERFAKAIHAGMDQFGGVDDPSPIVRVVEAGLVEEERIDASVRRILEQSFAMGIFEDPYVDPAAAAAQIGSDEKKVRGREAQAASMVLLEADSGFPVEEGTRVLLSGVSEDAARRAGLIPVNDPAEAQLAILRTRSPAEMLHPGYAFGAMHQEGSLAFPADHPAVQFMASLPEGLPLVADIQLDRPAILRPFRPRATTLIASFGASDDALFDVLTGAVAPRGQLPFELPSSMAAVEAQRPGAAADSADPLYPLGYRREN